MVQKKSSPPKRAASTLVNFEIFPSPGVAAVWVGGIPAGIAAVRRYANGRRFHQRFLETAVVVQCDDGAGGTVVVDPLHVPHAEAYTAGGSAAAEFVVLPCLQRGLVLPVIRHGVEQVRTGNARGILPVDTTIERPPDILVGRLVRPCFRGRSILPARRHKRLHRLRELAGSIQAIHNDEVLRRVDRNAIVMTALVGAGVCASIDEGVVDFGRYIANGTAVCDGPVDSKGADTAVHGEVYLAGTDVPVPELVPGDACVGEVHFAPAHVPPAKAVLGHAGIGGVDDAVAGGHPDGVDLRDFDTFGGGGHTAVVGRCGAGSWFRGGQECVQLRCFQATGAEGPKEATEQDQSHCQACCNSVKFQAGSTALGVRNHASFLAHHCPLLRHLFYPNYTGKCYLSQANAESREQAFNLLVRRLLIFDLVRLLK